MLETFTPEQANEMGAFVEDAVTEIDAAKAEPVNEMEYTNEKTDS